MAILSTDASTALRRKTVSSGELVATTTTDKIPFWVAPRALTIKQALLVVTVTFTTAGITLLIGDGTTNNSYASFAATSSTQAKNTVLAATVTGTLVPNHGPVTASWTSNGGAGKFIIVLDWEPQEQDVLT